MQIYNVDKLCSKIKEKRFFTSKVKEANKRKFESGNFFLNLWIEHLFTPYDRERTHPYEKGVRWNGQTRNFSLRIASRPRLSSSSVSLIVSILSHEIVLDRSTLSSAVCESPQFCSPSLPLVPLSTSPLVSALPSPSLSLRYVPPFLSISWRYALI